MRRAFLVVATILMVALFVTAALAHHKPGHPIPPGHQTTTTEGPSDTTTTTSSSSSTTTTISPESSTSLSTTTTQAPTTSTSSSSTTSTTTPATTTTAPTTTTTAPSQTFNLTADWLITDDLALSNFHVEGNGHAILIDGADISWSNFTINNVERVMWHGACGVATLTGEVTNSGGPNIGEYPLHWHLCGDTTRGSVVRVTVRNSPNRAFVPHGSHGISILDSRAENITGPALWWDFPGTNGTCAIGQEPRCDPVDNSNDILVDGLVVEGVHPFPGDPGRRLAAFVLGAGDNNTVRNSTALNVSGGRDCSGFLWPEFGSAHSADGANTVWTFENNHSVNADPDCHGIFVWQNEPTSVLHLIDGFAGDGIGHGAYINGYHYRNVGVSYVEAHAAGWGMSDSHVGVFESLRHRNGHTPTVEFTNVTFDRFIVNNGDNSGEIAGIYVLDNTNLSCGDIEYQQVVSGTKVVIDGSEC